MPKQSSVSCLNDYRPVALTSVIMKCIDRLILVVIQNMTDPYQFEYRENRSVEDAVCKALRYVYKHLDKMNTYARMLFIDYRSAFNTSIPSELYTELTDLVVQGTAINILEFTTIKGEQTPLYLSVSMMSIVNENVWWTSEKSSVTLTRVWPHFENGYRF